jgi:hypothetical protein
MVIRYRRSSLKTMLGITAEKKRIKRELGITALLRPFRWWGNEKRDIKREFGYYTPEAQLARHVLPHSLSKLALIVLGVLGVPFALGWLFSSASHDSEPAPRERTPAAAAPAETAERQRSDRR